VAVEQRQAGMIRREIDFDFLIAADHHNLQHFMVKWIARSAD